MMTMTNVSVPAALKDHMKDMVRETVVEINEACSFDLDRVSEVVKKIYSPSPIDELLKSFDNPKLIKKIRYLHDLYLTPDDASRTSAIQTNEIALDKFQKKMLKASDAVIDILDYTNAARQKESNSPANIQSSSPAISAPKPPTSKMSKRRPPLEEMKPVSCQARKRKDSEVSSQPRVSHPSSANMPRPMPKPAPRTMGRPMPKGETLLHSFILPNQSCFYGSSTGVPDITFSNNSVSSTSPNRPQPSQRTSNTIYGSNAYITISSAVHKAMIKCDDNARIIIDDGAHHKTIRCGANARIIINGGAHNNTIRCGSNALITINIGAHDNAIICDANADINIWGGAHHNSIYHGSNCYITESHGALHNIIYPR